jgi:hypothetical protein
MAGMATAKKLSYHVTGAVLILFGLLNFILIAANDHTRRLGGHDLRPLWRPGVLMVVGGFAMLSQRAWVKKVSSLLLAAMGAWIVFVPLPVDLFRIILRSGLFIPLIVNFDFLNVRRGDRRPVQ